MKLLLILFLILPTGISSRAESQSRTNSSETVNRQHLEQMKNMLKVLETQEGKQKRIDLLKREIAKVEAILAGTALPDEPPRVTSRRDPNSSFIYPVAIRTNVGGKYRYIKAFYSTIPSWGRMRTSEGKFWVWSCFFEVKNSSQKNLKVAIPVRKSGERSYIFQRVRRVYQDGIVETDEGLYGPRSYYSQTYDPTLAGQSVIINKFGTRRLSKIIETYGELILADDNKIHDRTEIILPVPSVFVGKRVIYSQKNNFDYGVINNVFEDRSVEVKKENSTILNLKDLILETPSPLKGEKIAIPWGSRVDPTYRVETVEVVFENGAILDSTGHIKTKFYKQVPSDLVDQYFYGGRFDFLGRKINTVFENNLAETSAGVVSLAFGRIGPPSVPSKVVNACNDWLSGILQKKQ
jgi:hypothetical protein